RAMGDARLPAPTVGGAISAALGGATGTARSAAIGISAVSSASCGLEASRLGRGFVATLVRRTASGARGEAPGVTSGASSLAARSLNNGKSKLLVMGRAPACAAAVGERDA